ncbi:MAG: CatA-like O-acetyltransferase [Elusimicrobiota bacterium]
MKFIDIDNWNRKKQFKFFSKMDYPHFNICFEMDLTPVYGFVKESGISIFKSILYFAVRTANDIEEFRYRIRDGKVIMHSKVHPSVTVRVKEEEFSFCPVDYDRNAKKFFEALKIKIREVKENPVIEDNPERDDFLFITSIPWISFTSIQHPVNIKTEDSVPRISWGKYFDKDGKIMLPFSVQAHHGLMDGIHMGKFRKKLQDYFNRPEEYLPAQPV